MYTGCIQGAQKKRRVPILGGAGGRAGGYSNGIQPSSVLSWAQQRKQTAETEQGHKEGSTHNHTHRHRKTGNQERESAQAKLTSGQLHWLSLITLLSTSGFIGSNDHLTTGRLLCLLLDATARGSQVKRGSVTGCHWEVCCLRGFH